MNSICRHIMFEVKWPYTWSSLVRDEGTYRHNGQTNQFMVRRELSLLLFCNFINTTSLHLLLLKSSSMQQVELYPFFIKMGQSRTLFVYFRHFSITISTIQIESSIVACLGFEPAAVDWQAEIKPRNSLLQDWSHDYWRPYPYDSFLAKVQNVSPLNASSTNGASPTYKPSTVLK